MEHESIFQKTAPALTPQDVADAASRVMRQIQTESARQKGFADLMVTAISGSLTSRADEAMINGEWRVVRTTASEPFILSDTPVVTWERLTHGFNFGIGFERPNLEVILPVSPSACLHICLRLRGQPHLSRQPYQRSILFKLLLHATHALLIEGRMR